MKKRIIFLLIYFSLCLIGNQKKINLKEYFTQFIESFSSPQDWQECKDQCLTLGIQELSLEQSVALRLLVQEKIAIINNPKMLINASPAVFFDNDEYNYNHLQSPLYKYESILEYILTYDEFQRTKKEVYSSAKGSISQCIALYKKIIKRHKKLLKKIDTCLETYIIYQQHLEHDQFRK